MRATTTATNLLEPSRDFVSPALRHAVDLDVCQVGREWLVELLQVRVGVSTQPRTAPLFLTRCTGASWPGPPSGVRRSGAAARAMRSRLSRGRGRGAFWPCASGRRGGDVQVAVERHRLGTVLLVCVSSCCEWLRVVDQDVLSIHTADSKPVLLFTYQLGGCLNNPHLRPSCYNHIPYTDFPKAKQRKGRFLKI